MKKILFLTLIFLSQSVFADTKSDSEKLFNWAETQYPEWFVVDDKSTISNNEWFYRYYPLNNTYLGVNIENGSVYIVGDKTSGETIYLGSLPSLLSLLNEGIDYTYLVGDWGISQTITTSSCNLGDLSTVNFSVKATVDGDNISLTTDRGTIINGNINDHSIDYTTALPSELGITPIEVGNLVFTDTSVSGSAIVTLSKGSFSCTIEASYAGTKL
jgi:hypothetical protein